MFGGKLKTWMETHIGRQKKSKSGRTAKEPITPKTQKVLLESSESLAQSDTGISSSSIQVLSSTTDGQESYCTTTIESDRGAHHGRPIHLSSPESAYSTGYSTDGASPGDALHPEYYINIRTGKHYFPSPAPTPTSPNPHPRACITTSFLSTEPRIPPLTTFPSWLTEPVLLPDPRTLQLPEPPKKPPKSPLSSLKNFLKSPKQDKVKPKSDAKPVPFESKKSPTKSRKWFKQPFKFSNKNNENEKSSERRDEPDIPLECASREIAPVDKEPAAFPVETTASPRQRTRIRTNPWIPTEHLTPNIHHLQLHFPPNLLRNRSCTNTPLQQRKTPDDPPLEDRFQQISLEYESSKRYLASLEKAVHDHIGQKLLMEISDHSEEDITLNEMMGTFNESYVYEKETDILSDSDPTDCEDYVSDSEAIHGGDEDSHDDELDFIDTGSMVAVEEAQINRGRCSYYDVKRSSFLCRNLPPNGLDTESRRNSRKEKEARKRRREEKKRRSMRKIEKEDEVLKVEKPIGGNVDLRKVLLQRTIDKNCSKSAENSPVGGRRQALSATDNTIKKKFDVMYLAEDEADMKYSELIKEAEIMLESLTNTPVAQKRFDSLPQVTPTRSPRRHSRSPAKGSPKFEKRRSPKHLGLKLSVNGHERRMEDDKKSAYRAKASAHSPLDPLGPTFRNFSVFKAASPAKKISSSSSDEQECAPLRPPPIPSLPFGFQFVDLGTPTTSHCPQSEPVKRKMYTCSKTFDRLVKTFDMPSSPTPRRVVPAFYNPLYSPGPSFPATARRSQKLSRRQ